MSHFSHVYYTPLFNFPLFLAVETLVEPLAMLDLRKAVNKKVDNKGFFPFLLTG
jgi:hypothetical protein